MSNLKLQSSLTFSLHAVFGINFQNSSACNLWVSRRNKSSVLMNTLMSGKNEIYWTNIWVWLQVMPLGKKVRFFLGHSVNCRLLLGIHELWKIRESLLGKSIHLEKQTGLASKWQASWVWESVTSHNCVFVYVKLAENWACH